MKYNYSVYQQRVDEHIFWVAKSSQLKGCVGQGETSGEAVKELEENEAEWLKTAKEYNIDIPPIEIKKETSFSGKFALRMTPFLHEQVDAAAKEQHVSVNHLICEAVAFYIGKKGRQKLPANISLIHNTSSAPQWRLNSLFVPTLSESYNHQYMSQ